jgi:hypothetical protein
MDFSFINGSMPKSANPRMRQNAAPPLLDVAMAKKGKLFICENPAFKN